MSSLAASSRTGTPLYAPNESDLYRENPAPPVRYIGKLACDFIDTHENLYWSVHAHDKLFEWYNKSCLKDMIEDRYNDVTDTVFFVRQNVESKREKQVFDLPEGGEDLKLTSSKKPNHAYDCRVIATGLRTTSTYAARGVRWMLVRDLQKE